MKCSHCGVENSDSNKFCPSCGSLLGDGLGDTDRYVANCVTAELAKRLKDQTLVEVEIAEAVATRLSNWGRLAGYFLGGCIGLLVAALGLVGIRTSVDLQNIGKTVQEQVSAKFEKEIAAQYQEAAKKVSTELEARYRRETEIQLAEVKSKREELTKEFQQLKTEIDQVHKSLNQRIDSIQEKVDQFKFQTTPDVSEETQRQVETALNNYQEHLFTLGYVPATRGPVVNVVIKPGNVGVLAYYDPSMHAVVVNSDAAKGMDLVDLVLREYSHRVLISLNNYERAVATSDLARVSAVQAGMVTFLACSFRNKSFYGGPASNSPYNEDLSKQRKLSAIRPGIEWSAVDGSPAWGSLFWTIRKHLGQESAERCLIDAWKEWKIDKDASSVDFAKSVLSHVKARAGAEGETRVRQAMIDWGLEI